MSTTPESYASRDRNLAIMLKALAHPARIAILRHLARRTTCICGELVDHLPLAQATVSQHLKAMKEAGLIRGEVDGPRSCYCINPDAIREVEKQFGSLITKVKNSCC